jgi:hypothetical protein
MIYCRTNKKKDSSFKQITDSWKQWKWYKMIDTWYHGSNTYIWHDMSDVILLSPLFAILYHASTHIGSCSTVSDTCCKWYAYHKQFTSNHSAHFAKWIIHRDCDVKTKQGLYGAARTRWRESRDKDYELTQRWHHQQNEHIENQREWLSCALFIYQDHGSEVLFSVLQINKRHVKIKAQEHLHILL